MLIEIYKGVEIFHDGEKDEFYTKLLVNAPSVGKKEYVRAGRLGKCRNDVDKFLNTAAKKPVIKKVWWQRRDEGEYVLVDVVLFSVIGNRVMIQPKECKQQELLLNGSKYRDDKIFLQCKENDSIVSVLNKKNSEIEKIKKEISCSSGKLIPLSLEHFK